MKMEIRKLKASEIEAKVKTISAKGCQLLLYKTARTDMDILDETFGVDGWSCEYKEIKGNLYCGICLHGEKEVWKWDCGIESREDGDGNEKKGEASDAFKRAGFKVGIGRELYSSPFIWASVETEQNNGKWALADRFAKFSVQHIAYKDGEISELTIVDNRGNFVFTFKQGSSKAPPKQDKAPEKPSEKTPEQKYTELLRVKGLYTDALVINFNKMDIQQKRAEFERVKGM